MINENCIKFDISVPCIKKALDIALEAHRDQIDKGGVPYIMHPITVANQMETTDEIVVALLHDVVEDSNITIEHLNKFEFSYEVIAAISTLTKTAGEEFFKYLDKVKKNEIALKVKIADMKHNSKLSRLKEITIEDIKRQEKYFAGIHYLSKSSF